MNSDTCLGLVWRWAAFAILAGLSAGVSAQESKESIVTRIYDVRSLLVRDTVYVGHPRGIVGLYAQDAPLEDGDVDSGIGLAAAIEIPDLITNLKDCTNPKYWDGELVGVAWDDPGLLVVRADAAMHSQVSDLLRGWKAKLLEQVTYEVHILPGNTVRGVACLLSPAAADALFASAGPHQVVIEHARVGKQVLVQSLQTRDYVDVGAAKVEQSAAALRPNVAYTAEGLAIYIESQRGPGDRLAVSWEIGLAEPLGDPVTRGVPSAARTAAEPVWGDAARPSPRTMQVHLPRRSGLFHSAGAMLADGEAVLGVLRGDQDKAVCVRLRRDGMPPHVTPVPMGEAAGLRVMSYPVGYIVGGTERFLRAKNVGDVALMAESVPMVVDEGHLQDLIKTSIASEKWDGCPFTMCLQANWLFVRADADTLAQVGDLLGRVAAQSLRQFEIEVRHGIIPAKDLALLGTGGAETMAERLVASSCRSLVRSGVSFCALAGKWTSIVSGYDPILADESVLMRPVITEVFEGVNVVGVFAPEEDGQGVLDLGFTEVVQTGKVETFDLKDDRFSGIDLAKTASRQFDVVRQVKLGRWSLVQAVPIPGSNDHSVVVARVQEIRQ